MALFVYMELLKELAVLNKSCVLFLSCVLSLSEECLCSLGELLCQTAVTSLGGDELAVVAGGFLGVDGERILALSLECRVLKFDWSSA